MKKLLIFNHFLLKVAELEKRLLGTDDTRVALVAIIFSQANVIRRYISGCSMEYISSCQIQYAQDLFWLICLNAKAHGDDLLKYYNLRAAYLFAGEPQYGAHILQDVGVERHCESIYPTANVDSSLYGKLVGGEIPSNILYCKTVDMDKLKLPEPDADTAAIDRALERLAKDKGFIKLLRIDSKFDTYGRSMAHAYYAKKYKELIPNVSVK